MRALALGLHALNLAAVAGLLFLCQQLLRAHDALAAMVVLGVAGLLVLLQFSKRLQAWRYVMPGVSAVLVFIVLPMAFTLGIAFTNYSSAHLLSFERATDGADTFFPGVHFSDWTEVSRVHHKADAEHAHAFDMVEYLRNG